MAHDLFPDPAAVLPGEAEMLSAVLANLTDDLPKLVYADWLEERGEKRGPFLREFTTAARSGGKLPERYGRGLPDFPESWNLLDIGFTYELAERDLLRFRDGLLNLVKPAIAVITIREPETHFPLGGTKFGGLPHLSIGSEWPRCPLAPLQFLAQFNLRECHNFFACRHLPEDGLLSVFLCHYNTFAHGEAMAGEQVQIVYTPEGAELEPLLWPDDLTEALGQPREPCRLLWGECLDLPYPELDSDRDTRYGSDLRAVLDDPRQLLDNLRREANHLMFGYSHPTVIARDPTPGPEWQQLFQFESDNKLGWNWGDGDRLFWHIRPEDLKARRFDRTEVNDG